VSTVASVFLAACFSPSVGSDELEPGQQPGSVFDVDAGAGATCTSFLSPLSSIRVRVRTTPFDGSYAPDNIGAIWVEDSTGTFVKTIEKWAKTRVRYLTRWNDASKGNVVDAITSATLQSHVTHDRRWNLLGLDRCQIPAGDYRIIVETTDHNGTGDSLEIPFTFGQSAVTLTPAETGTFHDLMIELK
jgi:hypothetical protein